MTKQGKNREFLGITHPEPALEVMNQFRTGKDSKWEAKYIYNGTSVVLFLFINLIGSIIFDSFHYVTVYMLSHHEAQYCILHVVQRGC